MKTLLIALLITSNVFANLSQEDIIERYIGDADLCGESYNNRLPNETVEECEKAMADTPEVRLTALDEDYEGPTPQYK